MLWLLTYSKLRVWVWISGFVGVALRVLFCLGLILLFTAIFDSLGFVCGFTYDVVCCSSYVIIYYLC